MFHSESAGNSGRSCDAKKPARKRPKKPPVRYNERAASSSDSEIASVELSGQGDTSNSSSVCTPTECVGECVVVEEDLFESLNLFTNLAEALLLSPPPLFCIHEEEPNLEEGFLWSYF